MNEETMDKRVYKTLTKIEKSMVTLLNVKSYDDISIKDICDESGISRGTFYQHYRDKDDFLFQYQKAMMKKGKRRLTQIQFEERRQFFEHALKFWINEGELLLLLLRDNGAYIVHQAMKKNLQQNIEVRLVPIMNTQALTNKEKYFLIIFMSNAVFGVLQDWVQRGRQESPKEIALMIDKVFNTVFV
ncbi:MULTISPECIES: TetR/AcrR family transcriptional regulator [Staphylococcus]|uniref:TetR/AcrR family transcriptional regulator n=1 Tax=Staphylococcus TaxID=1279 RepID=UPI0003C09342|nr:MULTISPECIES: TetR/AcrR family transcriptional regulator [Staphylococcus]QAV30756.1 TetR/AcrR family transcriptional regulator [Sulfitobacter donghicola]AGZ25609.1 TetR family transcriptional regulator [Staphylococcus pasteuri SP1]KAB7644748.1 TetR/AcrR family transcriptional regulator [Staphylococcus sp. B2-b]MBN6853268.1 TetR/AcrR family transcriptional regulator [Staphylococcus warneri]MBT2770027.1 TetR/AcrR family transcriptional regulator [Staphylococcus warneri]